MQYKFNKHLSDILPLSAGKIKILVAVSGGADSMCLLELLRNTTLDIEIEIAHVNFHLRGEESDMDESFVCGWARQYSIPCHTLQANTIAYAKEYSISIEMAAREIRYDWFRRLKEKYSYDYIAVAHHSNDNAETLILNLVRGAGIAGIRGMKSLDPESGVIRPLLVYSRQDIEKYLAKHNIPYRTDHTNLESDFARNRIRNLVLPQLEKINPSVISTLNRDMRHYAAASSILEKMARQKRERLCRTVFEADAGFLQVVKSSTARDFMIKMLAAYHQFHIKVADLMEEEEYGYWLYELLRPYGFNSAQVEDFSLGLAMSEVKRIVSPTHIAVKERGYIKVYEKSLSEKNPTLYIDAVDSRVELPLSGGVLLVLERAEISEIDTIMHSANGIHLVVDAAKLIFPLELRNISAGDKFSPFGMKGMKKLNDYLSDIKIDNLLKERVPVLCNGGEKENPGNIICMPGLQISNRYRITDKSESCIVISIF